MFSIDIHFGHFEHEYRNYYLNKKWVQQIIHKLINITNYNPYLRVYYIDGNYINIIENTLTAADLFN